MMRFAGTGDESAICLSDVDRRIIFTSDSHLAMLGLPKPRVIGADWQGWMIAEDADRVSPQFQAFWKTKEPYEVLVNIVRPDGTLLPVVSRCSMIKGQTKGTDLLFCETQSLEHVLRRGQDDRFACARFVQDLTYELASLTGRRRFADLTNALLEASASAERAIEMLAAVGDAVRAETPNVRTADA